MVEGKATTAPPQQWSLLIEAIATRGDREAFAQLFAHFAPRVKTYLRRRGADDASAEELAHEALLTVWRKAHLFDPQTVGASAWIFTIARNLSIDSMRRGARRAPGAGVDIDVEFVMDAAPLPEHAVLAAQIEDRVQRALTALSAEQRRVVELSFYQDKAHAEIAGDLGIPLGTVKSRLRLAMAKLRELLGDLT